MCASLGAEYSCFLIQVLLDQGEMGKVIKVHIHFELKLWICRKYFLHIFQSFKNLNLPTPVIKSVKVSKPVNVNLQVWTASSITFKKSDVNEPKVKKTYSYDWVLLRDQKVKSHSLYVHLFHLTFVSLSILFSDVCLTIWFFAVMYLSLTNKKLYNEMYLIYCCSIYFRR